MHRPARLIVSLFLGVALAGCGGGGEEATPGTEPVATVVPATSTTAEVPERAGEGADESGAGAPTGELEEGGLCADDAEGWAVGEAAVVFPDNSDETWTVEGTTIDDEGRVLVELVPGSPSVGYERFRFIARCDGSELVRLGAYALDGGAWMLLSVTDAEGSDDLPTTLER